MFIAGFSVEKLVERLHLALCILLLELALEAEDLVAGLYDVVYVALHPGRRLAGASLLHQTTGARRSQARSYTIHNNVFELSTKFREMLTTFEKTPFRASSLLKVSNNTFTLEYLLASRYFQEREDPRKYHL